MYRHQNYDAVLCASTSRWVVLCHSGVSSCEQLPIEGLYRQHLPAQLRQPLRLSAVAAAPQVYGSTRIPDGTAAEEIGMLTQLWGLKDLELNQCAPPLLRQSPLIQQHDELKLRLLSPLAVWQHARTGSVCGRSQM
jgi:hypothetical protein